MIDRLFSRFADLYGVRFTEAGNDRMAWTRELGDFELAAVAYAVTQSEKRYAEWPPNLAIFKSLCREYVPPADVRIARERALQGPFESRTGDSEIAKRHKGYIRALLELPGGDEAGLREYLQSTEHEAIVRGARRR